MTDFNELSKEALEASSAFIDTNWRADWDYSLKAFRNEHAAGSKYLAPEYAARSKLFRPKTRSIIRKNEAAAASSLFSNMDVVNITPGNPDDPMSVAAAAADKELLEFRMTRTLPAFPLVMGALQDAQTMGAVCSYQYWKYQKRGDRKIKDEPCIELRPMENIRIDGGADWLYPVESSPYFCDIIPMYVCDVRAMMNNKDDKTGKPKWKSFKDDVIEKARPDVIDTTRKARLGKQQDPIDERPGIKAFDIVWVMRWFMRDSQGEDHTFYKLGDEEMLTDALPIDEVYFHGQRPYVMGYAILETHKVMKTSLPILIKPLQQETNQLQNSRLDNVQFVLNKRWIVARGRQVDVQSLVRNVPGGVTLATDPKNDVQESNWADVTSSAYVEQDRINADLDELAGNFSPSTKVANNAVNDTLGGSKMAFMGAGLMSDYLIRTFIETWYEPVLRQVLLLERHYETDDVILGICANKARLFTKFGLSQITDDLLMKEVNVCVNVGMGSANPNERMQKFLMATQAATQLVATAPPGFNVVEGIKEIYSNAGYRDGSRFFSEQQDPRLLHAMQMVQQLQQALKGKQMELQQGAQVEQMKLLSAERIKDKQLQVDYHRIEGDLRIRQAEIAIEQQRLHLEALQMQMEMQGASEEQKLKATEIATRIQEAQLKLEGERQKIAGQAQKLAAEVATAHLDLQQQREAAANESRIGEVATNVTSSMQGIGKEIQSIASALADAKGTIEGMSAMKDQVVQLGQGLGLVLHGLATKKQAKGLRLKKAGGKTSAVEIQYHDGTSEEMPVA